jgi:hypothetical protein
MLVLFVLGLIMCRGRWERDGAGNRVREVVCWSLDRQKNVWRKDLLAIVIVIQNVTFGHCALRLFLSCANIIVLNYSPNSSVPALHPSLVA